MSDHAIPTAPPSATEGLEGQPRMDAGALEESLPHLIDAVLRGPLVLTRHGRDAFVLLPVDLWQRVWAGAKRPPVIEQPPPGKPRKPRGKRKS